MAQLSAHTLEDGRGPSEGPGLPLEAGAYVCGTQAWGLSFTKVPAEAPRDPSKALLKYLLGRASPPAP